MPRRSLYRGSRTEPQTRFLNDEQWNLIADLFLDNEMTRRGGRPPVPNRACFEGALWVLKTGAQWRMLPRQEYPSKSVVHGRFKLWVEAGLIKKAWRRLLKTKAKLGQLDLTILIGDGTFAPAKKGANTLATPKSAEAARSCC
ncbi:transposase [Lacunimicrobium album]